MTGIRLDSVEILTRIHVSVEDMGMYIDLSEGRTRLRLCISVWSRRRSLFIPLHSLIRAYASISMESSISRLLHGRFQGTEQETGAQAWDFCIIAGNRY